MRSNLRAVASNVSSSAVSQPPSSRSPRNSTCSGRLGSTARRNARCWYASDTRSIAASVHEPFGANERYDVKSVIWGSAMTATRASGEALVEPSSSGQAHDADVARNATCSCHATIGSHARTNNATAERA